MNLPTRRLAVVTAVVAAVAALAAAALLVRRHGPRLRGSVRRQGPGATQPEPEDLTERPVPRSVAALSTPPHFEQDPNAPEPDA